MLNGRESPLWINPSEIPNHWDLGGKRREDLNILQLDVPSGLLCADTGHISREYFEAFYSEIGKVRDFFQYSPDHKFVRAHFTGSSFGTYYRYDFDSSIDDDLLHVTFAPHNAESDLQNKSLGMINYKPNRSSGSFVQHLDLDSIFVGQIYQPQDFDIILPMIQMRKKNKEAMHANGRDWKDWAVGMIDSPPEGPYWTTQVRILSEDSVCLELIRKRTNQAEYELAWKIDEDILLASMTHVESQMVKTIEAPLTVPYKALREALFSHAPHKKDTGELFDVPWTRIPRLVGASLRYPNRPPIGDERKSIPSV